MPDAKGPPPDPFTDLLTRLVRVPKAKIDQAEREYQESKRDREPAKPREIVPPAHKQAG